MPRGRLAYRGSNPKVTRTREWCQRKTGYGPSGSEYALEYRVDVTKLAFDGERFGDLPGLQRGTDLGVGFDCGAKIALLLPGAHGVALHETIGMFAQHAGGGEVEQELAREDQASGQVQVAAHPLGIDHQLVD